MGRKLPGGRTASTQSASSAAAVAAATQYAAAAPGTPVAAPAHVTPERVAIITGASPPPPPASGPTIIKPQPGSPVQPLPEPSPTFDDDDTGADGSTENPYLSLLGDGPATLTDSAGSTATAGDDGREFPWLIGALVLVVGLVGFLLFRRS